MVEVDHSILAGKRIVVTRAAAQALELLKALQSAGAIPILLPLIRILPVDDFTQLDSALRNLSQFDLVLFTSQNAVRILHERAEELSLSFEGVRVPQAAAVGEATAAEASSAGFQLIHVAARPVGIALVEEMGTSLAGKRVLLPRSDRANPDVVSALKEFGAEVIEVIAYRTVAEDPQTSEVVSKALSADALLLFSPSAVEGFASVCGEGKLAEFAARGVVLASGPVTLAALKANSTPNATAASEPSVARILDALANSFRARNRQLSSEASTG